MCVCVRDTTHDKRNASSGPSRISYKKKVDAKEFKLLKIASSDNTSNLGTKRLALPLFKKLTSRIIDKTLRVNL